MIEMVIDVFYAVIKNNWKQIILNHGLIFQIYVQKLAMAAQYVGYVTKRHMEKYLNGEDNLSKKESWYDAPIIRNQNQIDDVLFAVKYLVRLTISQPFVLKLVD